MKIEDFIKANKPRKVPHRGKLDAFIDAIHRLDDLGYSVPQIVEYLKTEGVEVSRAAVHSKIKKHRSVA